MAGKVEIDSDNSATVTITINGNTGQLGSALGPFPPYVKVGGASTSGTFFATDNKGATKFLVSYQGFGELGLWPAVKTGADSDLAHATVHLRGSDATVRAGGAGTDGRMLVLDKNNAAVITLSGATGDILLQNADCAEQFDISEALAPQPGTVMVLDESGFLQTSHKPYDKRVAGVVSGIGGYRPGVLLDVRETGHTRVPLALIGKVYCLADATSGAIAVGDLLTTAPTAGHAMKASDPGKAFGAILGKALKPLHDGCGLIPVLVTLQ